MKDTTVMLYQIIWPTEHFGEGCVVQGDFLAKQGGPIQTGGHEAREHFQCPRKPESMRVSWCRLQR